MYTYSIIFLSTGIIFVIMAYILKLKPPKKINWIYGYRTPKAMKSQQAWDAAQSYSNKLMKNQGALFILVGVIAYLLPIPFQGDSIFAEIVFPLIIIIIGAIYLIYKTEKHIDKTIDS